MTGVLVNGPAPLTDAAQFSLGALLAQVFRELPELEEDLRRVTARALGALRDAGVPRSRKSALLTVISSMASAPCVWRALDEAGAVGKLLRFRAAEGDPRLSARALSLVKVLNRPA